MGRQQGIVAHGDGTGARVPVMWLQVCCLGFFGSKTYTQQNEKGPCEEQTGGEDYGGHCVGPDKFPIFSSTAIKGPRILPPF